MDIVFLSILFAFGVLTLGLVLACDRLQSRGIKP